MTMGEAATALSIQPPTVTKMVNRLSVAGLVRTEVVDQDRRKINVTMTDAGKAKIGEIDAIWHELEVEALDKVEPQSMLRTQLSAIIRNLSRSDAKAPAH
jgi:DNA-binding MarR family transcriptional regulator